MRIRSLWLSVVACLAFPFAVSRAAVAESPPNAPAATYDAELARRVGADERGMRKYVLVILKTGAKRVPDGPERDAMFAGHFANMQRWAKAGQLAVAGPFSKDASGWRGLYVFSVDTVEAARALVETDPVVQKGEMVPEFHDWYGTAAAMLLPEWHERLVPPASKQP
ncbi:YciI family protein [Dokdonella sp.]|uniref:YciI family protein n=1 Tax=Dokdonella sp. TaxID=2291710 RepID=UPI001B2EE552|nr:YciI family protein [Dokdonella sp.]MBO9664031.1 hypothetical protein [Dokdonella sp.]